MQEDRFDEKIRELLNRAEEQYDGSSWDALSQRLDEEDQSSVSDETFIPVVKQKLDNHRVPVQEEHWTSLKSDLDFIEERRERLYIVKALEVAIVLLLVYTYFNFHGFKTGVTPDVDYLEELYAQSEEPSLIEAVVSIDVEETAPTSFDPLFITQRSDNEEVSKVTSSSLNSDENVSVSSIKNIVGPRDFELPTPVDLSKKDNLQLLEKRAINEMEISLNQSDFPFLATVNHNQSKEQLQDGWSIGIPLSYDANFINTDINLGYLSNQIKSGLGGTTFGISIAKRKGNIELESGLRYSEKTFVPGLLTNYSKAGANSFLESQLDHMVIKQLQIPLIGKIYAAPDRKATLYGVAGVSVNTILDNQYSIRRTTQSKARLANAPTTDVIDLKNLPEGFFHGGAARENIYMTGVVGFGVQSYMVNGLSWYIQPQYQHSLTKQINALVSDINSLSIEAGLKFSF